MDVIIYISFIHQKRKKGYHICIFAEDNPKDLLFGLLIMIFSSIDFIILTSYLN
jgi:hypothetical protein